MKRRDIVILIGVAVISGIFSLVLANALFSPKKLTQKVPVVQKISDSFPDVKNDPTYNSFLNDKALDLTQPVQIGPHNQNQKPFNSSP
jgi:hypothetical protein